MATLLRNRWVFRYAALYGGVDPMAEAAEGTDLGKFLLQGFHAAIPSPPWIVGAFVRLYVLVYMIGFDAIGCPAIEACMGIAPVLPELLALAHFGRLRFLVFALKGTASSTACGQLCTTIYKRLELFQGPFAEAVGAMTMALLGYCLRDYPPPFSVGFLCYVPAPLALLEFRSRLPLAGFFGAHFHD